MSAAADWGMKCPKCGSTGPFRIAATSLFTMYADGADDHEDIEWDGNSYCDCTACYHSGTVSDFETE